MKAYWWSFVLGLLCCMPAQVILMDYTWTVSQLPLSLPPLRVNSSVEITCSTSLSNPMGLLLKSYFHSENILFLALRNGQITKITTADKFAGRIHWVSTSDQQMTAGSGFTLQLSQLQLDDTDLYYCDWTCFQSKTSSLEKQPSKGTIILVTDKDPPEQCKGQIFEPILIFLSVTAFTVALFLCTGALIFRCRRFKKRFSPTRGVKPSSRINPQHVCPQHRDQHVPYYTPANACDFMGIL